MEDTDEKPFAIERAKQGRAACKKCKQKCEAGELRIAKLVPSPYDVMNKMKSWHHVDCLLELFLKQRVTTKRIESLEELDGFDVLDENDKLFIIDKINECEKTFAERHNLGSPRKLELIKVDPPKKTVNKVVSNQEISKDSLFKEFRRLVVDITNENSYLNKSKLVENMFKKGSSGNGFTSDIRLWCHLLLPGVVQRVYNLQSKQLVKLFSRIFNTNPKPMLEHLKNGDVSETISLFFEQNTIMKPTKKSTLTLEDVDEFLEQLTALTKEEDQILHLKKILPKCTVGDLKVIVRLIKHDLRMNAGAKHILDGVHPDAYEMYQSCRDLDAVIEKCLQSSTSSSVSKEVKANISLMTPVLPMLAQACKSLEAAMKKCPNGIYSEIKYDGERVQVHKKGSEFKYYSRSLKPVLWHKIEHFKKYIPQAFPHAEDLILDSEILMVDTATGKPLPFGTLGKHKKSEFKDATVCLFVFDCIYYNGKDLTKEPIKQRKKILSEKMTEIPNHIMFSEMQEINKVEELSSMIKKVLTQGLEGLVLKDTMSIYEPGKRHWLKMKKDYLFDGAIADSADLIVLGAWYGTGKKGGMMSTFLMGCYDESNKTFVTVTKVHTGLDDDTLEKLQTELDMIQINCDYSKVPSWLVCSKIMTPDFVANDPKNQPVWQIIGAEFTQHDVHTADGISIRFPRIVKFREDKNWESATNLNELRHLVEESKVKIDIALTETTTVNETNSSETNPTNSNSSKRKSKSPKETTNKKIKRENVKLQNPIPRYFDGIALYLADEPETDITTWFRYFIAYGGTVLDEENSECATHILYYNKDARQCYKCPNVTRVHFDWLKHSIFKKEPQDCNKYLVYLLPDEG